MRKSEHLIEQMTDFTELPKYYIYSSSTKKNIKMNGSVNTFKV